MIQSVELTSRLRAREAKIDNDASIREFQRAKTAYEEQLAEWQKLASTSKLQLISAQSEVAQLEAKTNLLTEAVNAKAPVEAEAAQKLAGLNSDIDNKRKELNAVDAELQVSVSRKQTLENQIMELQKDYAAKKVVIDQLEKKVLSLTGDVSSNSTRLKAQLEEIAANDSVKVELASQKAELAALKQEKAGVSSILNTLKEERDRVGEDRTKLNSEVKGIQSEIETLRLELQKLRDERKTLSSEISDLKLKSSDAIAPNGDKPEGQK